MHPLQLLSGATSGTDGDSVKCGSDGGVGADCEGRQGDSDGWVGAHGEGG